MLRDRVSARTRWGKLSALTRELEAATSAPARRDQDYAGWTLTRLIDHITAVHHAFLKANPAQNAAYARKIADVHGEHRPELGTDPARGSS